jgi:hypothetical protein
LIVAVTRSRSFSIIYVETIIVATHLRWGSGTLRWRLAAFSSVTITLDVQFVKA